VAIAFLCVQPTSGRRSRQDRFWDGADRPARRELQIVALLADEDLGGGGNAKGCLLGVRQVIYYDDQSVRRRVPGIYAKCSTSTGDRIVSGTTPFDQIAAADAGRHTEKSNVRQTVGTAITRSSITKIFPMTPKDQTRSRVYPRGSFRGRRRRKQSRRPCAAPQRTPNWT